MAARSAQLTAFEARPVPAPTSLPPLEPILRATEALTVSASPVVEPARLLGPMAYPPSLRSMLAPYRGERVLVHAVIDEEGTPRVISVSAGFPLSRFAEERLAEVVRRTHWEAARDGSGEPVASRVAVAMQVQ